MTGIYSTDRKSQATRFSHERARKLVKMFNRSYPGDLYASEPVGDEHSIVVVIDREGARTWLEEREHRANRSVWP